MTSYQWWLESAGGSFSDPNNWESGTAEPPQGPPGPGDIVGIVNEPYTPTANGITVNGGTAMVSQLAFEGTVTVTGAPSPPPARSSPRRRAPSHPLPFSPSRAIRPSRGR